MSYEQTACTVPNSGDDEGWLPNLLAISGTFDIFETNRSRIPPPSYLRTEALAVTEKDLEIPGPPCNNPGFDSYSVAPAMDYMTQTELCEPLTQPFQLVPDAMMYYGQNTHMDYGKSSSPRYDEQAFCNTHLASSMIRVKLLKKAVKLLKKDVKLLENTLERLLRSLTRKFSYVKRFDMSVRRSIEQELLERVYTDGNSSSHGVNSSTYHFYAKQKGNCLRRGLFEATRRRKLPRKRSWKTWGHGSCSIGTHFGARLYAPGPGAKFRSAFSNRPRMLPIETHFCNACTSRITGSVAKVIVVLLNQLHQIRITMLMRSRTVSGFLIPSSSKAVCQLPGIQTATLRRILHHGAQVATDYSLYEHGE